MCDANSPKIYTTNVDPKLIEQVQGELLKREQQQQLHYNLLANLQSLASELPGQEQQRISTELLSSLSSALLDGTVFDIVRDLQEVQHLEEKTLYTWRSKVVQDQKTAVQQQRSAQQDLLLSCLAKPHEKQRVQAQIQRETTELRNQQANELQKCDVRILRRMDELSSEQQSTLQAAGVPGFKVSNDPREVTRQMTLLRFIRQVEPQFTGEVSGKGHAISSEKS